MPLVLHQGVELGTDRGLERLYQMVKDQLRLGRTPTPRDMSERLVQIREMEKRFMPSEVQQFERYINVVLPAPGQLATQTIPDDAVVESDETSLQLFGFIKGSGLKWKDIVRAAQKTADRRWLNGRPRFMGDRVFREDSSKMRSALIALMLAAVVLPPGLITARASAPGPIIHSTANPSRIAPTNIADDGLGIAGVDIGHAGISKQSRMTYVNSLLQETQATVWARCDEILRGGDAAVDAVAFCPDVLSKR